MNEVTNYSTLKEIRKWLDFYGVIYKKNERKAQLVKRMNDLRVILKKDPNIEPGLELLSPEDAAKLFRLQNTISLLNQAELFYSNYLTKALEDNKNFESSMTKKKIEFELEKEPFDFSETIFDSNSESENTVYSETSKEKNNNSSNVEVVTDTVKEIESENDIISNNIEFIDKSEHKVIDKESDSVNFESLLDLKKEAEFVNDAEEVDSNNNDKLNSLKNDSNNEAKPSKIKNFFVGAIAVGLPAIGVLSWWLANGGSF